MKTTLLKKVRKRFSIYYYPNGYKYAYRGYEVIEELPCVVLKDNSLFHLIFSGNSTTVFKIVEGASFEDIYDKVYERLCEDINHYYNKYGKRRNKTTEDKYKVCKKLWYDDSEDRRRKYELQQAMKSWDA